MQKLGLTLLESILLAAPAGIVVHDGTGRIAFANPAAERILGLGRIAGCAPSDLEFATVHADGSPFPATEHPAMVTLRTGQPCTDIVMGIRRAGDPELAWINVTSGIIPGPDDAKAFAILTDITPNFENERRFRDLSERLQRSNAALAETEARLRSVLHTIPDMVWTKDLNGVYLDCNPEFELFFGASAAEIVGKTDYEFVDKELADSFRQMDAKALAADGPSMNEEFIKYASDGHGVLLETIKTPMRDAAGRVIGVLGIARNITARRDVERQLRCAVEKLETMKEEFRQLSRTDPLTGLANRRAFDEAMKAEVLRCQRFRAPAALLMIDIDRFKRINDVYGHDAGDRALVALAALLKTLARATDLPARFGGEEFVVLLAGTRLTGAVNMAERIRLAVSQIEVDSGENRLGFSVSIGVTALLAKDADWSTAISRADRAMYRAKERGRNRVECIGEGLLGEAV